jgi:DNA-binding transcriptional MocR family regulator
MYRRKCHALCDALDARLADVLQFQRSGGGMFVRARMTGVDSSALPKHAIAQKVLFVPGQGFCADNADPAAFRLSFAGGSDRA